MNSLVAAKTLMKAFFSFCVGFKTFCVVRTLFCCFCVSGFLLFHEKKYKHETFVITKCRKNKDSVNEINAPICVSLEKTVCFFQRQGMQDTDVFNMGLCFR